MKKTHALALVLAAAALTASCFGKGGHDSPPSCPAGEVRCACYGNATCNPGLECRSGLCVGGLGFGGADGSVGTDPQACFACGQRVCPQQAQACQQNSGCADVVRCWLGCASDATCTARCNTTGVSADALAALSQFSSCALTQCAADCTGGASTGAGGNGGPTGSGGRSGTGGSPGTGGAFGGACSTAGAHDGACSAGTASVCTNGIWQPEVCTGCGILIDKASCGRIDAFVLDSTFVAQPANVVSFQQTATSVSATFNFTAVGQVGYIQFRFSHTLRPVSASVYGGTTPESFAAMAVDATMENADGSAGCDYTVTNTGLINKGCWGAFVPATGLSNPPGSPTSVFNLRLNGGTSAPAGIVSMMVTELGVYQ